MDRRSFGRMVKGIMIVVLASSLERRWNQEIDSYLTSRLVFAVLMQPRRLRVDYR